MSEPDIMANIARGWNCAPAAASVARAPSSVSAALWVPSGDFPREVRADSDPSFHMICVPTTRFDADMLLDGKFAWHRSVYPGSICIVSAARAPGAVHYSRSSTLHLYMPAVLIDEMASEALGKLCSGVELVDPACMEADAYIGTCARAIENEIRDPVALSSLRIDVLAQDVAINIVRRYTGLNIPSTKPRYTACDWRVSRAIDYLEAHIGEDVGLVEIAATVGMTAAHLAAVFRAAIGEPPHRWMMRRRFERACDMLADARLSITEIALACGFASSQHMATVFQRRLGMTPSVYRRERLS